MPTVTAAYPINNAEFADHPEYDFSAVIDRMEKMANVNSATQRSQAATVRLAK
jgi:hypothetical protein